MTIVLSILTFLILGIAARIWFNRRKELEEVTRFSITPTELHSLLGQPDSICLLDVRLPLDLLADPHIIPGSVRMSPKEVALNPAAVPKDRDIVFYCTCPSDGTSRIALHHAQQANYHRVKFLRGGLAAWKAQGFPVETYETAFHLDTL